MLVCVHGLLGTQVDVTGTGIALVVVHGATPWVDAACLHCRLDAWVSAVVSTEAMHAVGPVVVAESVERTVSLIVRGSAHLEAEGAAAQIEWMRAAVALVVVDRLAIRGVAALLERRADPLLLATLSDGW